MKKILLIIVTCITLVTVTACNKSELEEHLHDYISNELAEYTFQYQVDWETGEGKYSNSINNDVATAILLLNSQIQINFENLAKKVGLSIEEVTATYEDMEITDVYTAFNMTLAYQILDLDLDDLKDWAKELSYTDIKAYDSPYSGFEYAALSTINTLNMLGVNDSLKNALISHFDNFNDFTYMDADFASLIVKSLQGEAHKDYLDYLYTQITSEGVKNYSGEVSCSSTSQVLMALMSEGVIYKDNMLFETVLSFRTENGFKEYLDDEERNISYTSPQAFCALATAYLFEETAMKIYFY